MKMSTLTLTFFTAIAVLHLLLVFSGAVGSAGTLAISSSSATVCGLSAGASSSSSSNRIYCTTISVSPAAQPLQVLQTLSFESVSGGSSSLCALESGGGAFFCWDPSNAGLYPPVKRVYNGTDALTDLTVGDSQIAAVDQNQNSIRWWRGGHVFPQSVPGTYSSLTSGQNFSCAIDAEKRVQCWGPGGDVIQSAFANNPMSSIVAGDSHVCGLDTAGKVICKGNNDSGQLDAPEGSPFEFTSLALGSSHTCAIQQPNGTAICWGGSGGATGGSAYHPPSNSTEFEFLVAGGNLTCGLTTANFAVLCWGSNPRNLTVTQLSLPKILPGVCVASASDCNCGIYPDSESLCSGTGSVICRPCNQSTTTTPPAAQPPPPPPPATPPSGSKPVSTSWKIFAIIGSVGSFAGICSILYCLFLTCRRKKVHNSVLPTVNPSSRETTNTNGRSNSSGSRAPPSPLFRSFSASRFVRQRSRVFQRQRSGPSSFKDRTEEFSFSDLETATQGFSLQNKIGAGSFGTVYRGVLPERGEVAVKRGHSGPHVRRYQEKENAFQSELSFLSRVHHKHLVGLVGFCIENDERLLVYEFMKNGALYNHLHPKNGSSDSPVLTSWKMRIKLLLDAARGIEYLHDYAVPPVIHRDIKSSNILLDVNWLAKVSDFGLSMMGPAAEDGHLSMKAAGTVGYMDPEYYGMQHLTVKSDVYSFGVVMLETLTGKRAIFKEEGRDEPVSVVDYAVPMIESGYFGRIMDDRVEPAGAHEAEAVELVAYMAVNCVRLEGKDRPFMADVVANLETALALLEGSKESGSSVSISLTEIDARD